jgi:hypothetical protein
MSWRLLQEMHSREAFLELVSLTGQELLQPVGDGDEPGSEADGLTHGGNLVVRECRQEQGNVSRIPSCSNIEVTD